MPIDVDESGDAGRVEHGGDPIQHINAIVRRLADRLMPNATPANHVARMHRRRPNHAEMICRRKRRSDAPLPLDNEDARFPHRVGHVLVPGFCMTDVARHQMA